MDPHKKRIRNVIKLAQQVEPLLPISHAGPGRGNKKSPKELATQGNRKHYLMARIKRDHPDILHRCLNGEFSSVTQAAIVAGILRKKVHHCGKEKR